MRRRRALIAVALLTGAAFAAWKWMHQRDARLVGRWLVTEDVPATAEQLQAATDEASAISKFIWTWRREDVGRHHSRQQTGSFASVHGGELRWWTSGDRLRIQWGAAPTGWRTVAEFRRALRGELPSKPDYDYGYVIEGPDSIWIETREMPWTLPGKVLYLTRLTGDEP